MTPDEIKKALECCKQPDECSRCPYDGNIFCQEQLSWEALDYIKQLESDLQLLRNDYEHSKSVVDETVERNQRLREKLIKALINLKTAKSEAIREFSERLKIKGRNISFCPETTKLNYGVTFDDINDLVTEIVGDENYDDDLNGKSRI